MTFFPTPNHSRANLKKQRPVRRLKFIHKHLPYKDAAEVAEALDLISSPFGVYSLGMKVVGVVVDVDDDDLAFASAITVIHENNLAPFTALS